MFDRVIDRNPFFPLALLEQLVEGIKIVLCRAICPESCAASHTMDAMSAIGGVNNKSTVISV